MDIAYLIVYRILLCILYLCSFTLDCIKSCQIQHLPVPWRKWCKKEFSWLWISIRARPLAGDVGSSSAASLEAPGVCLTDTPDNINATQTPSGSTNMSIPLIETENTEATTRTDLTSYVNGIVEGTDMHIMLDSGATISFISEDTKTSIPSLAKRPC